MGQRTNSAQQRARDVSQLASAYQLGASIGEYPKTRKPEGMKALSALGVLLLGLFLIYFAIVQSIALVAIAGSALSALGLIYSVWSAFYLFSRSMYAFTDGFIYFKRGKPVVFRWEDVSFVLNTQRQQGLVVAHYVEIKHADGHWVTFRIRDMDPFISLLHARVAVARKPKMMKEYEAGKVLKFGPLDLSLAGVSYQKRSLPWSDVERIFLLSGTLHIRTTKEPQSDWATILGAERIPSISLLVEMTRDILKEKRPSS